MTSSNIGNRGRDDGVGTGSSKKKFRPGRPVGATSPVGASVRGAGLLDVVSGASAGLLGIVDLVLLGGLAGGGLLVRLRLGDLKLLH
ncbi:hypothetical protein, partial [Micromonospora aurantiaca (nom. illeg.)]|uniref:hypothetical protein n=1 Tax=Micromonospora aurantiaca (nom. illeg.) TaxID=47850 RepID=UPI00223B5AB7